MLPAEESISSEEMVWMESMMRLDGFDMFEDALSGGLGDDVHLALGLPNAVSTHLYLLLALFAADVEEPFALHGEGCLEEESGFTDAGFAAEEQEASRDDAATEDAVELAAVGLDTDGLVVFYLLNAYGCRLTDCLIARLLEYLSGGLDHLFIEGVPLATLGTAAEP